MAIGPGVALLQPLLPGLCPAGPMRGKAMHTGLTLPGGGSLAGEAGDEDPPPTAAAAALALYGLDEAVVYPASLPPVGAGAAAPALAGDAGGRGPSAPGGNAPREGT